MLRVLHLRSSRTVAGPERQIVELARMLPEFGIELEVAVLTRRNAGGPCPVRHPFVVELEREGVAAWELADPDRAGRAAGRALARRLARGDVAIVHSHDPKANWVAARAPSDRAHRVATIHLHTRATAALRLHAWADRLLLRRVDRLIAVSENAGSGLRGRHGRPPRIIANGVDARRLEAVAARDGDAPAAPARALLAAGRLTRQKGFDVLLEALPPILACLPSLEVVIAGDGPARNRLVRQARRLGLEGAVVFAGERDDLPALMARARAVVAPSRDEGSPYTLLEAMALSTPIVASAVGGVPDLLAQGGAGRLVPPEAPEALAAAVVDALTRTERSRELARRARELAGSRFSAGRMAAETAEVYRELSA